MAEPTALFQLAEFHEALFQLAEFQEALCQLALFQLAWLQPGVAATVAAQLAWLNDFAPVTGSVVMNGSRFSFGFGGTKSRPAAVAASISPTPALCEPGRDK